MPRRRIQETGASFVKSLRVRRVIDEAISQADQLEKNVGELVKELQKLEISEEGHRKNGTQSEDHDD